MTTNWFFRPTEQPEARVRLLCFPHAGVGAAVYRTWAAYLPEWIELTAIQPPGRAWRLRESMYHYLPDFVDAIHTALTPELDRPVALFGHSMGAWVAFEVARVLELENHPPVSLFVSGRRAPHLGSTERRMDGVSDEEFTAEMVRRYGGIPDEILHDPEALSVFLPTLRADVAMLDRYRYRPGAPLRCPVHAYAGSEDPNVERDELELWRRESEGDFTLDFFPGGHFFLETSRRDLIRSLVARIEAALDAGTMGEAT